MMWIITGLAILAVMAVLLWGLWRREGRRANEQPRLGLAIPLTVVSLTVLLYAAFGYNSDTATWLRDQREYQDVARDIIAGDTPSEAAADVPARTLVRVLQAQLHRQDSATGWYALGSIYDQLGAPARSEEAARKALAITPDNPAMHLLLARALIEQSEGQLTDPALEQINWVLDRWPEHDGAWMLLAMASDRAGRFQLAAQAWQSLLSRHDKGETADMLRQGLARAEQQQAQQARFEGLSVTVAGKELPAGGTLFVFLRRQGGSGQPLAALRHVVRDFPTTVSLKREDWLQSYPQDDVPLQVGARYTPAPGASVGQASITAEPQPLALPQDQSLELMLQ